MKYRRKWYDNRAWLRMMYIDEGRTVSEIAVRASVTTETMRKLLDKYELRKNDRSS